MTGSLGLVDVTENEIAATQDIQGLVVPSNGDIHKLMPKYGYQYQVENYPNYNLLIFC